MNELYKEILLKYTEGRATNEEQTQLTTWLDSLSVQEYEKIFDWFQEQMNNRELEINSVYTPSWFSRLENRIEAGEAEISGKLALLRRVSIRNWVAAAVIILAIGSGIYYFNNQSYKSNKSPQITLQTTGTGNDISPGTNKAILTTGDQTINLSNDKTGIAVGSAITYNDGERITDAGQFLQLTTPRGGQYQAVLPDGSKVWLNAASSIKFPSKFSAKERRVEVTGEAYFEIAKKLNVPFSVTAGNTTIQVLGTSFNINAYPDEESQKTTLISGAVKVLSNSQEAILKPGQQAQIINYSLLITNSSSDVIAWKNGTFNFQNMNFPEAARQLERWYDIEVVYEGVIPNILFKGDMDRGVQLSEILRMLTVWGVRVRMEGKKMIVE